MRYIVAQSEPPELTVARPTLPLRWKTFRTLPKWQPVKKSIHNKLYFDQLGVCAYCEGRLDILFEHIEHVEPKGGPHRNPSRIYDYSNFVASCDGETHDTSKTGQNSCGHFKGENYHPVKFVSPHDTVCERLFLYTLDGRCEVLPNEATSPDDHERAVYTRRTLNLDSLRLRSYRRPIARKLAQTLSRLIKSGNEALVQQFLNHHLGATTDAAGRVVLRSFYSTRKQRFFPVGPVTTDSAP